MLGQHVSVTSVYDTVIYVSIGEFRLRVCPIVFGFDDFAYPCIMHPLEL